MPTQCNAEQLEFAGVGRRRVVAAFDGGHVTCDAGALLLKCTDEAIGLIDRLASSYFWIRLRGRRERLCSILMPLMWRCMASKRTASFTVTTTTTVPLYIYCGRQLLCAKLRPANIDGAAGAEEEMDRILGQIRERWPKTRIILRADSNQAASFAHTATNIAARDVGLLSLKIDKTAVGYRKSLN